MLGYDDEHKAYVVEFVRTKTIGISRSVDFDESHLMDDSNWGEMKTQIRKQPSTEETSTSRRSEENIFDILEGIDDHKDQNVADADNDEVELQDAVDLPASLQQRPTRERRQPERFRDFVMAKLTKIIPPKSYVQAKAREDAFRWKEAYEREIQSLEGIGELRVVQRPNGVEVIPVMEIFEEKVDSITGKGRAKVRIVARGDKKKVRPAAAETFSPVVRTEIVRALR